MGILRSDRVSGLGGANAINGSVKFSYDQDALIVPPSPDFNLGTEDYTIEAWVYPEQEGASLMIYAVGDSDSTAKMGKFYYRSTKKFTYWCQSSVQITSSGTFNMGSWYHVALVNSSGTQTLYVNGVSQGTSTYSGFGGDAFLVEVGKNPSNTGQSMNGYISNLRVQKGKAEYTAAFTPPTTRLEKTPETVLLCCQSSSDVIQEATGKSLVIGKASGADSGPVAARFVPDKGEDHGTTFADNTKFDTLSYMVPPGGTTAQSNRGRCIVSNGSPGTQALYYLQMQSGGIAQSFGNLANAAALSSGCGSSTRMLVADGYISPASTKIIEYLTIATTSNGTNFGELTVARRRPIGMSNSTRAVWATGSNVSPTPYLNTQDYNTIATLGDATDFGDASGNAAHGGGVSSSTRGIYSLGYEAPAVVNTLDYIIIATTGSRANFGDLNHVKSYHFRGCSSSDSTRGLFAGGYNPVNNNIDYITMASTGDAIDFGDLSVARRSGMATGNSIDAIFVGGYLPGASNTIDKVTIQTTGNAVDFGDLTVKFHEGACSSDSHGGS